jgi:hypothetical protein
MRREGQIRPSEHRPALQQLERRFLLKGSLSAGALTMLTGCRMAMRSIALYGPCRAGTTGYRRCSSIQTGWH